MLALAAACSSDGGSGDGRATVDPDPRFEIGATAVPYRVVYRLDDLSNDEAEPSTDEVWVRQPFDSRLETSSGEPPGGDLLSVQVAEVDRLRLPSDEAQPVVVARVPRLAVSDVRVAPILDDALDRGLLELGGQRVVAERRCQVVRSGTLLGSGPLVAIGRREHAESCLDADGLLLEETLFIDGEPTIHRVAVEVDTDPELDDDLFDAGPIDRPVEDVGSARPVDPDAGALGEFWTLPGNEPPAGFARVGRFGIIPPQPELFQRQEMTPIVAGTADVFERGADFVVVYQGGTHGRVDAFGSEAGAERVDDPELGDGELILSALGSEVRFRRPAGRFVHVIGSLGRDELVAIAGSLVATEGTGLVYLER